MAYKEAILNIAEKEKIYWHIFELFNQQDRRVRQRWDFLVKMEQNYCCLDNWNLYFLSLTLRNKTKLDRKGFSYNAHCMKEEENDHVTTASRHGFNWYCETI